LKSTDNKWVLSAIIFLNFNPKLHGLLGFETDKFPQMQFDKNKKDTDYISYGDGDSKNEAPNHPNLNYLNVDFIFVYCDIIKESYIENTKTNILKIFAKKNNINNNITTYQFDSSLHIPLRVEEIHSIKLSLRNSLGEKLYYKSGHILATLLFRPVEYI